MKYFSHLENKFFSTLNASSPFFRGEEAFLTRWPPLGPKTRSVVTLAARVRVFCDGHFRGSLALVL